jgi:hypothetical protein
MSHSNLGGWRGDAGSAGHPGERDLGPGQLPLSGDVGDLLDDQPILGSVKSAAELVCLAPVRLFVPVTGEPSSGEGTPGNDTDSEICGQRQPLSLLFPVNWALGLDHGGATGTVGRHRSHRGADGARSGRVQLVHRHGLEATVQGALSDLRAAIAAVSSSGQIDGKKADELSKRVDELAKHLTEKGGKDADKHVDDMEKYLHELSKKGELTASGERRLAAALQTVRERAADG